MKNYRPSVASASGNLNDSENPESQDLKILSGRNSAAKNLDFEIKEKESKLAGLKAEIRSRQKIVSQMPEKNSDVSIQEKLKISEEEISLRDRQIRVLNDRLIVLDAQIKEYTNDSNSKQKDNSIDQLKQELAQAIKDKETSEEKNKSLENDWKTDKKKWEQEAEKFKSIKENFEKNLESQRSQIEKNKSDLQAAQAEANKLKKLFDNSSTENFNLNNKVNDLTKDLEISSKRIFESSLKIKTTEELQKAMLELTQALKNSENEIKAKSAEIEELKSEKSKIERVCMEQSQKVEDVRLRLNEEAKRTKELESLLKVKESSFQGEVEMITKQLNYAVAQLQEVKVELEEKKSLKDDVQKRIGQINSMQTNIQLLENTLREKERTLNLAKAHENTLLDRIKELEKIVSGQRLEKNTSEKQLNDKIKALENEIEKNQGKLKISLENYQENDIAKYRNQIAILSAKNEELSRKLEQINSRYSTLESSFKDLKNKNNSLIRENQDLEKTNSIRETQIKDSLNKIKTLETDLFTKESTLLSKEGVILKLTKDLEESKKALAQAHIKFRTNLAEELKNFTILLEQKEQEIKILKDMIRSGQTQLKQKETELSRFKNPLQPQSSTRNLQNSNRLEKSDSINIIEIFLGCLKEIDELKYFKSSKIKEINDTSNLSDPLIDPDNPIDSLNSLVSSRLSSILSDLQKRLKNFSNKIIETKPLESLIRLDTADIKVKDLIEIINKIII
jgi:hypothetical protein